MDLEKITREVTKISKKVGRFIQREARQISSQNVQEKGLHDLVTYVDREAENKLVAALQKVLPDAGFIAEENQQLQKKDRFNWIIDPLDGTTNFVHGIPKYCISVALVEGEEVISGVVYEINLEECFYAWKDGPAFLNEKEIRVSSTASLDKSLIATGFPYSDYSLLQPYLNLFEELMKATRGIRRLGSAALDLAYVACGRFELFFEYGLKPWDVAAGALIVKRAGGKVADFYGKDNYIFGRQIVASNPTTQAEFFEKLNRHFKESI